jgi:hypothetical protein
MSFDEEAGLAITLETYIREAFGTINSWDTHYHYCFFVVFISFSRQI